MALSPGQAFLLLLFLLYLSDCFILVPRRGFGFLSFFGRKRWSVCRPSAALGNDRAGLVFAMPLPTLGRAFVAGFWPISLTPKGFSSLATSCANPGVRPATPAVYIPWSKLKEVGWEARYLLVNGKKFMKLPSARIARDYTALLLKLAGMAEAERGAAIRVWCRKQLSAKRVRRRARVFDRATAGLRHSCNLLFLVTFFFVPITYWKFKLSLQFLIALGVLLLLVLLIGIEFWCLHKKLYPELKAERFQAWMLIGFMPQYSMRAVDDLSKGFIGYAHPLAVAEALLNDRKFERFRDQVLRDLSFPTPQIERGRDGADEAIAAALEFREEYERPAIEEIERRRSDEPVGSRPGADKLEPESAKFCPRCLMPYEKVAPDCIDCSGVSLVEL